MLGTVLANNLNPLQENSMLHQAASTAISKTTGVISNIAAASTATTGVISNIAAASRLLVTLVTVEDTKILKQIQATHAHDAQQLDVNPVLDLIQDIFQRAQTTSLSDDGTQDLADVLQERMGGRAAGGPQGTVLDALAATIKKVCCEFSCKCGAGEAHASAMGILQQLGNYSWDAKVVIALAAFAVTYGELWLVMLLSSTNPLARSIAVLKQTPDIGEIKGVLKPRFEPINELIKVMVDVAKSLIEFRLLPSKYISPEDPPLATSLNEIAMATYWTIRSIVASGAQIAANFGVGVTTSVTEAWDLSSLAHKAKSLHDHLVQRLDLCYKFIEEKKLEEAFNNLVLLFKATHKDNLRILKTLIFAKDDIKPLVEFSTKVQVNIEVLRSKTVLFFISDLDVSEEELIVLDKVYKESRTSKIELQYEIVWIPVVDRTVTWTKELEIKFQTLKSKMSWYSLFHPSLLDVTSIRFIKEVWGFAKKPLIVSLDPLGKVVSQNAYHMILIWGNSAYPFTEVREKELWNQQTWRFDFLLEAILPDFLKGIGQEDTHICLFGGEDIEWIRKFTMSVKEHAVKIGIKIELVYIGKHNAKDAVKKIIDVIKTDRLAQTLPDLTLVWHFWARLEAMMYSKMQYGNVNNDMIVKEVLSLLSFDGGDQGWGLLGSISKTEMVKGKGELILNCMARFRDWEAKVSQIGFLVAFREFLLAITGSESHHCNRLIFPAIEGSGIPTVVACVDCGRRMDRFVLYRCCTG